MQEARRRRVWDGAFLLLLAAATLVHVGLDLRLAVNPNHVDSDATAQLPLFEFQGAADPFRGDFLSEFMREAFVTPGMKAFYSIWPGGSPIIESRVLWVIAFLVALGCVVAMGAKLGGAPGASVSGVLLVNCAQIDSVLRAGLARSAAFPLAAAFLCATVFERPGLALILLPIQAAFYPTIFAVCAPALGLWILWRLWRKREERRRVFPELLLFVAVAGATTAWLARESIRNERILGPVVTEAEARARPEFSPGGRWPVVPFRNPVRDVYDRLALPAESSPHTAGEPFWTVRWNREKGVPLAGALLAATALALAVSRRARSAVPAGIWIFAGSSVAIYLLARMVAFRLYVPGRILDYSLPLVSILVWPVVLGALGEEFPKVGGRCVLAALLVPYAVFHGPVFAPKQFRDPLALSIPWEALRAAPRGSLVAADPCVADVIPLLTGQRVFVSFETALPLYPLTYREIDRRLHDYYAAISTTNRAVFEDFVRRNAIDFVVLAEGRRASHLERECLWNEPWGPWARDLIARSQGQARALDWYEMQLPTVIENRSVLVDVRPIRDGTFASGADRFDASARSLAEKPGEGPD